MPTLYSVTDYGDSIRVGGVIYKKVASGVPAVPDSVTPVASHSGAQVYALTDPQGASSYDADKHLLASQFGYGTTQGQPDGVQTLFGAAPFAGVMRIWASSGNGGNRTLYINGQPQTFNEAAHNPQSNAKGINIAQGDQVTIDAYWSTTYYALLYKFVYNGEDLTL